MSDRQPAIRVCGVVLRDTTGRVLTVRKRGTERFMLPGGKPERGESPEATATRECAEELGLTLRAGELALLGRFRAPAANEAGREVESTVFLHPLTDVPVAAAEIEALRWVNPGDARGHSDLAPLLSGHVIPALLAMDSAGERR